MRREIAKLPEVPSLTTSLISKLDELCFRNESDLSVGVSDTIFVFGTAVSIDKAAEAVLDAVNQVKPKKLVLSGGMPTYADSYSVSIPESELLYGLIHKSLPDNIEVHLETTSNNCTENVENALPFLQDGSRVTYITKSFGAGRHYLTIKKFLPNCVYTQKTFDALYPDSSDYITKADWHTKLYSISRVWGEFLRIAKYGSRGDIAYDEVKKLVDNIIINTQHEIP